jgi:hypothetical protein
MNSLCKNKMLFLTFFFSLKIWPLLCFFFPPENPFLQFTMEFIFVSTEWKFTPKKRPICIEGSAFGAHVMFLGWVKSGYGQFEVWTNVGSVCPFQRTHWILVLRFLRFGHQLWTSIYEGRLFVFCSVIMRYTELVSFRLCSWCLWKALHQEGCMSLDTWCKVFEYLMIFSLKIKLIWSWKFWRNWNVPFVLLLERSWWARFNGIYLVRFGFRMWEILIY